MNASDKSSSRKWLLVLRFLASIADDLIVSWVLLYLVTTTFGLPIGILFAVCRSIKLG